MAAERIGDIVYNIYDRFIGVPFNATVVDTWYDGSAMNDSKVDNAIYLKNLSRLGGGYIKRNWEGAIDARWFGVVADGVTDDTSAMQNAINLCLLLNADLGIYGKCKINGTLNINRNRSNNPNFFRIIGYGGGGFFSDTATSMFSSSNPLQPDFSPVSGFIEFNCIRFEGKTSVDSYVMEDNRLLRLKLVDCDFYRIKFATTNAYFQSISFVHCHLRNWTNGYFIRSNGGSFDIRFTDNCIIESGNGFWYMGANSAATTTNFNSAMNSVTNCVIENLTGIGIVVEKSTGVSITGNYWELNDGGDIIMDTLPNLHTGLCVENNRFIPNSTQVADPNYYSIRWGNTLGGCSTRANFSSGNLHHFLQGTTVDNPYADYSLQKLSNRLDVNSALSTGIILSDTNPKADPTKFGMGKWEKGQVIINNAFTNDNVSTIIGWVCTVAGTSAASKWVPLGVFLNPSGEYKFQNSADQTIAYFSDDVPLGFTSLLVKYCPATTGVFKYLRISVGAPDSAGAGFRMLRLPN